MLEANKAMTELSPVRTEYLQVNYAKASDLAGLIKSQGKSSLLSDRGSVSIDERTNTLLLQDTADRLADIRRLVQTLDIPVRQVLIEARIVIVNDDFSRELGVRFGGAWVGNYGDNGLAYVGNSGLDAVPGESGPIITPGSSAGLNGNQVQTPPANNRYLVNLPIANPAGKFAMTLLTPITSWTSKSRPRSAKAAVKWSPHRVSSRRTARKQ
jgi:type IV pilus assembly protein PilQ